MGTGFCVLFRCPERRRQCKEVGEQAVFLAWYKFDFEKCKFLFVEIGTVPQLETNLSR
jgi:hypothetical protein